MNKYICLKNNEDQYSLWFSWKRIPEGWEKVGEVGTKEECLEYIKNSWQDMTPKSLREMMNNNTTV